MDTDSEAASDMQSDEGYDSQEDYMEESSDDEDADYGFDGAAEMLTFSQRAQYKVLNKADMERRRKEAIEGVTGILGISEEEAARVLRKYKWDVRRVHEEWFADTAAVRTSVGLVDEAPQTSKAEETCLVCFDTLPLRAMRCAACKHYFCLDCWRCYVQTAVGSGPSCLDLRCPFRGRTEKDKCIAAVPTALVHEVLPLEDLAKYEVFQMRSFVEDNRGMSWCTGKGCENAVECRVDRAVDEALDVICTCGTTFCFNCKEEAHRPVSCNMVRQWIVKNASESENMNWILANTKPCPKCHRPIEKNQGCMHMTCSQCRYEFCWLCNGDWKEHGERTGGFYNCNRYEVAKKKGEYDDVAKRRDHAKASLERYMHYFERFDAHSRARDKARADAATVSRDWLETLSDATKTPTSQLKFIMDAWAQIIECRRQLKWTYAYGYYSFENESDAQIKRQREFFEFLQGDAERSLERLHEYAETDLKRHKDGNLGIEAFQEFRKKLIGMTDVTHTFFDKLVKQLERGFDDLAKDFAGQEPDAPADAGQGASSSSGAGTSRAASNGKANNRAADARTTKRGRGAGGATAGDPAARAAGTVEDEELTGLLQEQGFWTCSHCTVNNALTARVCEVCESPRQ